MVTADSDGGEGIELRFVREIVYRSGERVIEGVTLKQLPPPNDYSLTKADEQAKSTSDINKLDE